MQRYGFVFFLPNFITTFFEKKFTFSFTADQTIDQNSTYIIYFQSNIAVS